MSIHFASYQTIKIHLKTMERMNPAEHELLFKHTRHDLEILAAVAEGYLEWKSSHGGKPASIR